MENRLDGTTDLLNFETIGLCACGCGQSTKLAPHTDKARGWTNGKPMRFVRGHSHSLRGFPKPEDGYRWCCACRTQKLKTEFHKSKYQPGGLATACKACLGSKTKRFRPARSKAREYQLRYKYGISLLDYERLFAAQGGVCAICKRNGLTKSLAVDHDHTTGTVRGLLCRACNTFIGLAKESPKVMESAISYLSK